MVELTDEYGRKINYLRVSVTDRCNLRCNYCMPPEGVEFIPPEEILSFEEIVRIVKAGVSLGIDKVRLTGGEPLVRKDIPKLVEQLASLEGLKEVALTTNGVLLAAVSDNLATAGLDRVNISLDTLKPDRFQQVTGADRFKQVWRGVESSFKQFAPVKLNVVIRQNFNQDEILDFVQLTKDYPVHVRFIEFMPAKAETIQQSSQYISKKKIKAKINNHFQLRPTQVKAGNGPANYFQITNSRGTIGFISPVSNHFCTDCNRLRLTSTGELRPCLYSRRVVELKEVVRNGVGLSQLQTKFKQATELKLADSGQAEADSLAANMSEIGG